MDNQLAENSVYKCIKDLWPIAVGEMVTIIKIDYIGDFVDYAFEDGLNNTRFNGRFGVLEFKDSFIEWIYCDDPEKARKEFSGCQCGVEATYRDKKSFDTTYWHSYYCPKYKEKPKDEK